MVRKQECRLGMQRTQMDCGGVTDRLQQRTNQGATAVMEGGGGMEGQQQAAAWCAHNTMRDNMQTQM